MSNIIHINPPSLTIELDHVQATIWPSEHLQGSRHIIEITRFYEDADGNPLVRKSCYGDAELPLSQRIFTQLAAHLPQQPAADSDGQS